MTFNHTLWSMIVLDIPDAYASDKNIPYVGHCGGTCFWRMTQLLAVTWLEVIPYVFIGTSFLISECRHSYQVEEKHSKLCHQPNYSNTYTLLQHRPVADTGLRKFWKNFSKYAVVLAWSGVIIISTNKLWCIRFISSDYLRKSWRTGDCEHKAWCFFNLSEQ